MDEVTQRQLTPRSSGQRFHAWIESSGLNLSTFCISFRVPLCSFGQTPPPSLEQMFVLQILRSYNAAAMASMLQSWSRKEVRRIRWPLDVKYPLNILVETVRFAYLLYYRGEPL
jgi:hypothetical protein